MHRVGISRRVGVCVRLAEVSRMRRLWRRAPASKMKALQELRDRLDKLGPEACLNTIGIVCIAGSCTPVLPNGMYQDLDGGSGGSGGDDLSELSTDVPSSSSSAVSTDPAPSVSSCPSELKIARVVEQMRQLKLAVSSPQVQGSQPSPQAQTRLEGMQTRPQLQPSSGTQASSEIKAAPQAPNQLRVPNSCAKKAASIKGGDKEPSMHSALPAADSLLNKHDKFARLNIFWIRGLSYKSHIECPA